MVTPAVLSLLASVQVLGASVRIDLHGDSATVRIAYRLVSPADSVVLEAPRYGGHRIGPLDGLAGGRRMDGTGLVRLILPVPADSAIRRVLQYTVSPTDRIPVFVPRIPVASGGRRVGIVVTGLPPGLRRSDDGFPRWMADVPGTVRAQPANLPALVRPPRTGIRWTVDRVADVSTILMLVGASVGWLIWRRRA